MKKALTFAVAVAGLAAFLALRHQLAPGVAADAAERGSGPEPAERSRTQLVSERASTSLELGRASDSATPTPTSPAPVNDKVVVRTFDTNGAVVRHAELFATTDSGSLRLGSSGPDGEVELLFERANWTAVVGRHASFGPARVSWIGEPPAVVELRLPEASELSGRVVFADGQGAPGGLRVLAIPTRLNMSARGRTAEELISNPEFGVTLTESDGTFRFTGLASAEVHALHCGGRGLLVHDQPPYARAGQSDARITVARGYGVIFEFADVAGVAPCVPEVYGSQGSFNMTISDASAELVLNLPPSARLALGALGSFTDSPTRRLILLSSPLDLAELGPIKIHSSLPGYVPVEQECFAMPIESDLAVWKQPLIRSAQNFGALHLDLEAAQSDLRQSLGRVGPTALFEFRAPGQPAFLRVLHADTKGVLALDCLPFGPHELVFISQPETDFSRIRLGEVLVGPQPAQRSLPLQDLGALTVDARLPDGRDYVGEMRIALGGVLGDTPSVPNTPLQGGETMFRRPPYHFALLPAGRYRVWVAAPGAGSSPADVVVPPRGVARVALTIHL